MASTSGIRTSGSGSGEYAKNILLKDVASWCGGVGHIEQTCYSKINGAPRGGKSGVPRGRGRGGGAAGRGCEVFSNIGVY